MLSMLIILTAKFRNKSAINIVRWRLPTKDSDHNSDQLPNYERGTDQKSNPFQDQLLVTYTRWTKLSCSTRLAVWLNNFDRQEDQDFRGYESYPVGRGLFQGFSFIPCEQYTVNGLYSS